MTKKAILNPCTNPPHHWIVGDPTYYTEGLMVYERTEWQCKKCNQRKDNVVGIPIEQDSPPDSSEIETSVYDHVWNTWRPKSIPIRREYDEDL